MTLGSIAKNAYNVKEIKGLVELKKATTTVQEYTHETIESLAEYKKMLQKHGFAPEPTNLKPLGADTYGASKTMEPEELTAKLADKFEKVGIPFKN